jgi:hypothetical protein
VLAVLWLASGPLGEVQLAGRRVRTAKAYG